LGEQVTSDRVSTKDRPLPGAAGLPSPDLDGVTAVAEQLAVDHKLNLAMTRHLCDVYGTRAHLLATRIAEQPALGERLDPELPYLWAEVDFAVRHDLARTVEDVLARRVPLLLVSRDQGLGVCERVADATGAQLGWSAAQRSKMLDEYRAEVAL